MQLSICLFLKTFGFYHIFCHPNPATVKSSASLAKSTQRPTSVSNVKKKKTDEQLFEFLNSGPSTVAVVDKRAPQFTSTPVKQKPPQTMKQSDDTKEVIPQAAEKPPSNDEGELLRLNCELTNHFTACVCYFSSLLCGGN